MTLQLSVQKHQDHNFTYRFCHFQNGTKLQKVKIMF